MQMSPKTAMIIKIVLAVLTAVSNGTLVLTGSNNFSGNINIGNNGTAGILQHSSRPRFQTKDSASIADNLTEEAASQSGIALPSFHSSSRKQCG